GRHLTCLVKHEFIHEEARIAQCGRTIVTIITQYYKMIIERS
ncbi:unnamed protein product, partial [Rotaria sordida]